MAGKSKRARLAARHLQLARMRAAEIRRARLLDLDPGACQTFKSESDEGDNRPLNLPSTSRHAVSEEEEYSDGNGEIAMKEEYVEVECKVEVKEEDLDMEDETEEDDHFLGNAAGLEEEEEEVPRSAPPGNARGGRRRAAKNMNFIRSTYINVKEMSKESPFKSPEVYGGNARITTCVLCAKVIPQFGKKTTPGASPEDADSLVLFAVHLLGLPKEKLDRYRCLFGRPRAWIRFCDECDPRINEALQIQKQIKELETKLTKFEHVIKNMIAMVYAKNKETIAFALSDAVTAKEQKADPFHVTREIWSLVGNDTVSRTKANAGPGTKKPEVASSSTSYPSSATSSSGPPKKKPMIVRKPEATASSSSYRKSVPEFEEHVLPHTSGVGDSEDGGNTGSFDDNWCKKLTYKPGSIPNWTCYTCPLCPDLEAMKLDSFVKHIIYHKGRPYKCSICGIYLTGNDMELAKIPKIIHRKEGVPDDHVCTKASLVPVTFLPGDIWECGFCEEMFSSEEERSAHEKHAHRLKGSRIKLPYECSWCSGKKFRDYVEWRLHRALEHPKLAKLACFYCDEIFSAKTKEGVDVEDGLSRRNHVKERHGPTAQRRICLAECFICGNNSNLELDLQVHLEHVHGLDRNQCRCCPVCFSKFPRATNMRIHMKGVHYTTTTTSTGKEKLVCDMCGYETVVGSKFQEHKFMVHGIEPEDGRPIYSCTEAECNFKCTVKRTLDIHKMKAHNAARPHKCDTCGKGFLNSKHLRDHRQIHLNAANKPYQCEICGNSFAVKNYLYIHMRLSHQNRPFASTHKKKKSSTSNNEPNKST